MSYTISELMTSLAWGRDTYKALKDGQVGIGLHPNIENSSNLPEHAFLPVFVLYDLGRRAAEKVIVEGLVAEVLKDGEYKPTPKIYWKGKTFINSRHGWLVTDSASENVEMGRLDPLGKP